MEVSRDTLWEQVTSEHQRLLQEGAQAYLASFDQAALTISLPTACCMDERIRPEYGTLRRAGSLLFEWKQNAAEYGEEKADKIMRETIAKAGINRLTAHAGCGAAKALYLQFVAEDATPEEINQYTQTETQRLAKRFSLEYSYIPASEMSGSPHYHHAVAAYYVGAEVGFTPAAVGAAPGFIISRGYSESGKTCQQELVFAFKIAFSEHGFASRFTQERPFVVVGVPGVISEEELRKEITEVYQDLPTNQQALVRVDWFRAA